MNRRTVLAWTLGIVALAFLFTGASQAQENEVPLFLTSEDEVLVTEVPAEGDDTQLTLEELNQLFGAHNVCGIPCGPFSGVKCTLACGDAAKCHGSGFCVFR